MNEMDEIKDSYYVVAHWFTVVRNIIWVSVPVLSALAILKIISPVRFFMGMIVTATFTIVIHYLINGAYNAMLEDLKDFGEYRTIDSIIFALETNQIVCFELSDEIGVLYIENDKIYTMLDGEKVRYSTDVSSTKKIVTDMKELGTKFYKNDTIFTAELPAK